MSVGLLRLGLPRDPAASSHVAGFLVSAVVTVLLTRATLAALGYPQLGGDSLHIGHVVWGGLLMAVAFVLLLTFAGPVVRPLGAVIGGVGFGLFVDEIGKFVTADSDYFYKPTAALIYTMVVGLVLVADALHGRRPHEPREYLAGAVDHAVAGVAGGFTPQARAEARALVDLAGDATGAAETRALLDCIADDDAELPNPIAAVGAAVVRATRRVVAVRLAPWLVVGVLLVSVGWTVASGMVAWLGGADVPGFVVVGLLVGAALATGTAGFGVVVVRRDRMHGYLLLRRAILINLLVTHVFVFGIEEWSATAGLAFALLALGLVAAEVQQMTEAGIGRDRWFGAGVGAGDGVAGNCDGACDGAGVTAAGDDVAGGM